jgi:hypothetical protein
VNISVKGSDWQDRGLYDEHNEIRSEGFEMLAFGKAVVEI